MACARCGSDWHSVSRCPWPLVNLAAAVRCALARWGRVPLGQTLGMWCARDIVVPTQRFGSFLPVHPLRGQPPHAVRHLRGDMKNAFLITWRYK